MRRQIYNFIKEPALKYLALTDIEVLISKEQGDPTTTDEQKKALDFSFIQSVTICMCLQKTTGKFASERVVKPLFEAAQLNKILQLPELGGYADWTSEMLYMILDDNDQLVPIWSVMTPREINQQILDWLRDMKADADGIPKADWENYLYKGDRKLTRKNADQVTLTQQKKRQKKGMADLDESGQGVKEVSSECGRMRRSRAQCSRRAPAHPHGGPRRHGIRRRLRTGAAARRRRSPHARSQLRGRGGGVAATPATLVRRAAPGWAASERTSACGPHHALHGTL